MKPRLLEQVLIAYREGDLDECIRLVRTLVEAAPQATAPRQLLAALFAATGNGRLALAHYRRLLPQAVARGEVIRAIGFQKQIDVYEQPESLAPGRWMALQRQLREQGAASIASPPGASEKPWTEAQLLALPRSWFERIAAETRYEFLGLDERQVDVDAGTAWEILAGRLRWSFALPDGRASAESLAVEGDIVHVDPGFAASARVMFVPELPVEAIRFDAPLARDLVLAISAGLPIADPAQAVHSSERRAMLPLRPRRREDLDEAPVVPSFDGAAEPPRLPAPEPDADLARPVVGDGAGWVDFGVLSLSDGPTAEGAASGDDAGAAAASGPSDAAADALEPIASTPAGGPGAADAGGADDPPRDRGASVWARPVEVPDPFAAPDATADVREAAAPPSASAEPAEPPAIEATDDPVDPAEEPVRTPGPTSIAASLGESESVVERRRHPRVTVSFASRLALLRLAGSGLEPVEGQISDLSTSGFSIRFASRTLGASRGALADAVVAVDMDVPGPQGALRVAAQVRWLEADDTEDEARMGIEFVLLTESDRRRLAGTLARAALAAREQERKAA